MTQDSESGPIGEVRYRGVSNAFTNVQELATRQHSVLCKAMRYGRWYVLKCIAPRYVADEAHRQMLAKEFESMMRVQHPGIVQAYGIEEVPERGPCIVMEYVEGCTLEQWLAQEHDAAACCALLMQLLDAVEAIHQVGIVHRDLKLSNVMVTRVGSQVKIIDFGLADADRNAIFKHAAGTEGYISPEQAAGGPPDVRNDIYSLGVMIERMAPLLGSRYRTVVNRCKRPIGERYADEAHLRQAVVRADKRRQWLRVLVPAVLALAVMAAGVLLYGSKGVASVADSPTDSTVVATAVTDTATSAAPAVTQTPTAPQPAEQSAAATTPDRHEQDDRDRAVREAIDEGTRRLKACYPSKQLIHHLDTLTDVRYLNVDMTLDGLHFVSVYIEEIKPRFSDTELATISNSLYYINYTLSEMIDKRMDEIIKRSHHP